MTDLTKDFDNEKDLSASFDKEQSLDKNTTPSEEDIGIGKTVLLKGAQGATLGGLPILSGAASAASKGIGMLTGDESSLSNKSSIEQLLDAYRKGRDDTRHQLALATEKHPWISAGSELVGGIIPAALASPLLGASALAEAGTAGRIANAGLAGAELGGAAGLLGGEADLTKGEVKGTLGDVVSGAGTGAVLGSALHGVTEIPGAIKTYMPQTATGWEVGRQEGTNILSKAGKEKLLTGNAEKGQNISNELDTAYKKAGNARREIASEQKPVETKDYEKIIDDHINDALEKKRITPEEAEILSDSYKSSLKEPDIEVPIEAEGKVKSTSSSQSELELEKSKLQAASEALGESASYDIVPSKDGSHLSLVKTITPEMQQARSVVKSVVNSPDAVTDLAADVAKLQSRAKVLGDNSSFEIVTDPDGSHIHIVKSEAPAGSEKASVLKTIPNSEASTVVTPGKSATQTIPGKKRDTMSIQDILDAVTEGRNQSKSRIRTEPQVGFTQSDIASDLSKFARAKAPVTGPQTDVMAAKKGLEGIWGKSEYTPGMIGPAGEKGVWKAPDKMQKFLSDYNNPENAYLKEKEILPQMETLMGKSYAKDFNTNAEQIANRAALAKTPTGKIDAMLKSPEVIANVLGRAAKTAEPITNVVAKIANIPNEKLASMAQTFKVSNNPIAQKLGNALEMASKAPAKRNALMFAISQHNEYRDLLTPALTGSSEDKK